MRNRIPNLIFSLLGTLGFALLSGCVPADDQSDPTINATSDPLEANDPVAELGDATTAAPRLLFGITGIVGTGQSLSVGAQATAFSGAATQPHFNNLKLALNGARVPPFNPNAGSLSL